MSNFPKSVDRSDNPNILDVGKKSLKLVRGLHGVGMSLRSGEPTKALHQAIITGLKMADDEVFYNPMVSPLRLVESLQKLGIGVLTWAPEVLCATIDKKFHGWSDTKVASAVAQYHKTGALETDIPQLVREKIYAVRVVVTSNSAQTEWHVFEKVGGAFNDRIAKFGAVEPLSAAEAAKTVATIEKLRPDTYDNAIKVYIAGCCHQDGLYTVAPLKWLKMSEQYLQQMNQDSTGEKFNPTIGQAIERKLVELKSLPSLPEFDETDIITVQAGKLLAIDLLASSV